MWVETTSSTAYHATYSVNHTARYSESGTTTTDPLTRTLSNGETVTIPAHSVRWKFDTIKAGEASLLSLMIRVGCGTANGTTFSLKVSSDGVVSNPQTSSVHTVTVQSRPNVTITKDIANFIYP